MEIAGLPENEAQRLKALEDFSILDTLPEEDLDNLTRLASQICNTPIALITLIDSRRQWFKSKQGLDISETPRDFAFCTHAILTPGKIFTVNDSRKDIRFHDNPLVTGNPHVIFYSGAPLVDSAGNALGTLCVIDHKPNDLDPGQLEALNTLAGQVIKLFELHKANFQLSGIRNELLLKNQELDIFASRAAHDLRSPLNQIEQVVDYLLTEHTAELNPEVSEFMSYLKKSTSQLTDLINGILIHSRSGTGIKKQKESIKLGEFFREIISLADYKEEIDFSFPDNGDVVIAYKINLQQIFLNLVTNAIKYNDKETIKIEAGYSDMGSRYQFFVRDNGPGIRKSQQEKIFIIFEVLNTVDRFGNPSTGIGLATVKKIIEQSGGSIWLDSEPGQGSTFYFTLPK